MPVALLLQKMIGTLKTAAGALSPWIEIVTFESRLVERARSAFLVHWFGRHLPFDGLSLRAHIVNIAELDERFLAVQRSVPAGLGGPNLTEPLAGFAGMLTGMLVSPAAAITGASLLLRFSAFSLGVLAAALAWAAMPFLLRYGLIAAPALVGGGLSSLGIGFAFAAVVGDDRDLRAVLEVFGALAGLMNAAVIMLGQLTGPRAAIRNPLLARVLDLADRFAALLPQMLAAVVVLVTRIGPVLAPVARTFVDLGKLAGKVGTALGEVISKPMSIMDELRTIPRSARSLARPVVTVARHQLGKVFTIVSGQVDVLEAALTAVGAVLTATLDALAGQVSGFLSRLFKEHPVAKVFGALNEQVTAITTALDATPSPPPTGRPNPMAPLLDTLPKLPPLRSFPLLPGMPDEARLRAGSGAASVPALDVAAIQRAADRLAWTDPAKNGLDAPIELSEQSQVAVAEAARRQSVFLPELQALATKTGPPKEAPGSKQLDDFHTKYRALAGLDRRALTAEIGSLTAALTLNAKELERYRATFSVLVGRVLPPELRGTAIPQLVDPAELPVLDVPTSDELHPVVKRLRLHMPGANVNDVKRFQDMVTERLQRRSYRVTVGGR